MPKFICFYAHDVSCYVDFTVEATSAAEALGQIREALLAGKFQHVNPEACWENRPANQRVFVQGLVSKDSPTTTLAELIRESSPVETAIASASPPPGCAQK